MGRVVAIALVLAAIVGGAFFYMHTHKPPPPAPPPPPALPTAPPAPPPPPPDAAPAIRNPIEAEPAQRPDLGDSDAYVKNALTQLFGRKSLGYFVIDGFVRRFVITVDNLGNEHAPVQQWPVTPTAGRFEVDGGAIAGRNAQRYTAFVHLLDAVDAKKAVGLYRRLYPLCQEAYEQLGYPGKYFNDRLVQVIDDLIATPDLADPVKVHEVARPGASPSAPRLYQFDDPSLESRSAGQKILLRMGHANALRLKGKLREIRALVARGPR